MKVLHVSTNDRGGAGISCIRLHQSLLKQNVDSKVLLLHKTNYKTPGLVKYNPPAPPIPQRIRNRSKWLLKKFRLLQYLNEEKYLENQPKGYEMFSFANSAFDITRMPEYQECDVVNLHWVAGLLDYPSFFKNNTKKIVWTLHDMNPFTGGCHHADDCIKYTQKCTECPQLQGTVDPNYAFKMQEVKHQAFKNYSGNMLTVATPSMWLQNLSKQSALFSKFPHLHIRHGLDASVFKIYDKRSARSFFNLPLDKKVILFVSNYVEHPRKGLKWLLDVVDSLENKEEFILCSMGSSALGTQLPFHYQLGNFTDEKILALAYSVADVFVLPSFAENSPLSIVESFFCGIPVISFPVGGVPEMINSGNNGILAKEVSLVALKASFEEFFRGFSPNPEKIRADALALYDEHVAAVQYKELYAQLIT